MSNKDIKLFEEYRKVTYYCRHCGHSVTIYGYMDKTICGFCGYYVFRTPQDEFKFRLKNSLKNGG